jgi:hypothetical protein
MGSVDHVDEMQRFVQQKAKIEGFPEVVGGELACSRMADK